MAGVEGLGGEAVKPHDANGIEIRVGDKIRLTGTVLDAPDEQSIRIRPDRQPERFEINPWINPRVLEVVK